MITKPYTFGYKRGYCGFCKKRCPGKVCHAVCLNKAMDNVIKIEFRPKKSQLKPTRRKAKKGEKRG